MKFIKIFGVALLLALSTAASDVKADEQSEGSDLVVEDLETDALFLEEVETDELVLEDPLSDDPETDTVVVLDVEIDIDDLLGNDSDEELLVADQDSEEKSEPDILDIDELLAGDAEDELLISDEPRDTATSEHIETVSEQDASEEELSGEQDEYVQVQPDTPPQLKPSDDSDFQEVDYETIIDDEMEINFARNLEEYRSPRRAMLLSLLVPGLGQAYSRNYIKSGAFVAAEAVLIGVAIRNSVRGRSQRRDARDFADENYDPDQLRHYYRVMEEIHNERSPEYSFDTLIMLDFEDDFYDWARERNGSFYRNIDRQFYIPGWKDVEPHIDTLSTYIRDGRTDEIIGDSGERFVIVNPDQSRFFLLNQVGGNEGILGYSENQQKYSDMVAKSNNYFRNVTFSLYGILLNHVISALDAGITARSYNRALLGEQSVWDRISIEQQIVHTGSESVPGVALRMQF
ncbi:hypothetical protein CHISP_0133 [Chitinispirillum alkaliphilum]|nr:hypothetical protein CHISP_0133 [Chitinispirillum alkaliphilum]